MTRAEAIEYGQNILLTGLLSHPGEEMNSPYLQYVEFLRIAIKTMIDAEEDEQAICEAWKSLYYDPPKEKENADVDD